jgi:hypothetical protein
MKPVVKKGLWRVSKHDRPSNRDIRDFFEAIPRDTTDQTSDDEDEDHCSVDMSLTDTDDSSSTNSSESDSDSSSSSAADKDDGEEGEPKTGFIKLVEQKITNFFRAKPRPKQRSPAPRRQEPKPTEQERDHRQHCTTHIYHFFRRHPPDTSNSSDTTGTGQHG